MARPLSDAARIKILEAAQAIIADEGVAALSIDDVARRAGVAKTTVYRHFGSCDGIVLAAADRQVNSVESIDTGSLRGDLEVIVARYLASTEEPEKRKLFTWMLTRSMDDPEFASHFQKVRVQPQGPTFLALRRALARGEVDPSIPLELAMHIVQGPFMSKRIINNEELTPDDFQVLLDAVVRALRPDPLRSPT
jgi:AcrR family transcriptional regulator